MHNLSDLQVDIVNEKIKEQKLKPFAFSDELLDHVCCRIEQFMENGSSFESALKQTSYLYQRDEIKKSTRISRFSLTTVDSSIHSLFMQVFYFI